LRNIGLKLPDEAHREVLEAARAAYQAPSKAMAKALREDLVERYGKLYPSAVACFEEDFEACVAHLRCPPTHRKAIRTTNMLERLFLEERRRVKAAGHLFGERPVLKLMYGALIRVTEKWRGIRMHELERRQLERLQEQLDDEHRKEVKPVVETRSTPKRIYSKNRT
jgi:transposase-like protein